MIRSKRLSLLLLGVLIFQIVCLPSNQGAQVNDLRPPEISIPTLFFGMHIHHLLRGASPLTSWPSVPFRAWRLWDAYVTWADLEPRRGEWDFANLDRYVALAEQRHIEILLTLAWSPQWASARPSDKGYGPPGVSAEPKNIADWQNYVRTVGTRYKGRIHEYEIWNEPNSIGFYTGSIPELVQLARVAYTTLKQVDPTIVVSSPPAAGSSSLRWIDQYLKAGGGKYADVICYHFYVNPAPPEETVPLIEQVEQIMRNDGVGNKPLWNTEIGWAIQNNEGTVKPAPGRGFNSVVLSEDQAAAYVARTYVLAWASGVSRLYWYAWDNGVMGLVDRDGKTLKAPGIAYGQVENWLVGATMTSCGSDAAGIWTCAITRPGNYRAWIVWDPDRTVSFPVPALWKVNEIRDLSGGTRALGKAKTVEIGPSPLLLVASGS